MAIDNLTTDMDFIQKLDDEPNDVGGLSATELKKEFDKAGNAVKDYINNTLLPALAAAGVEAILQTADTDVKYLRLNQDGVIEVSGDGETWSATASSGHLVYDKDGTLLPQRSRLRFSNSEVTDDGEYTVVNGIKGDKGDQGEKGDQGIQGIQGEKGNTGPCIVPSVDENGVMSFKVNDTAIAPQSVSVRGPQGPQGVQGLQGAQGERGPQGIQGIDGPQGVQGIQGNTGPAGPTGEQGPAGPQGIRGEKGADGGSFVIQDIYATLGELKSDYPDGNEYAYQVTNENKEIFIWSERANNWESVGELQGPQGPQGIQGIQGPKGDTGPQGPQGIQGVQGPQGATGPQGVQGPAGVSGQDGKSAYQSAVEAGYSGTETAFTKALADVPTFQEQIDGKAEASHTHSASDVVSGTFSTDRLPTVPLTKGGTGATTAAGARTKLGAAAASHTHDASAIASGTLPIERGGTGATTAAEAVSNLGCASKYISDDTAALLGLDPDDDPVVDDALTVLAKKSTFDTYMLFNRGQF